MSNYVFIIAFFQEILQCIHDENQLEESSNLLHQGNPSSWTSCLSLFFATCDSCKVMQDRFFKMALVRPIKTWISIRLWDSHTSHIAALLLWSITSVHQQLCLSGHRVLGDISCDWSTPHVGPSLGDLLPEQSHAKDQPSDFCIFLDNFE